MEHRRQRKGDGERRGGEGCLAAGIGYLMTWGRKAFQLDVVMVTMVVIGIAGFALDRASLALSNRYAGWATRTAL